MKRRDKTREAIVAEYLAGGVSYRELELRHGISSSTLQRWVKASELGRDGIKAVEKGRSILIGEEEHLSGEDVPSELSRLRSELRRERLHNKLLNAMIDIAEEQMGVPIRKKRGTRR
jgi:transposase-like protein